MEKVLTFGAIVALPAVQTQPAAGFRAGVVSEGVVSRSTQRLTSGTVVLAVASHPVLVDERTLLAGAPLGSGVQPSLRAHSHNQFLVLCKN